jgi:hypothetical protein
MSSPEIPSPSPASPTHSTPAGGPAPNPGKSGKSGFFEDMVVTGFGMATSAAVAYGSFYSKREFHFAPYTWMANFVIPIGAIACGFVAAVGYWAGSRLFHHRPTRLLLVNIVLVSLGTFFSIHHLDYNHAFVGDRPLANVMSFPDYLMAVTEHMTYKSSSSSGEPMELGKLGWGVAALQVAGFCAGGFIVYRLLVAVPYCNRCSKYFNVLWKRTIRWKDVELMNRSYAASARLLQAGQLQPAVNEFAAVPNQSKFRAKALLTMDLRKCPTCDNRLIKLIAQKMNGRNFTKVGEVTAPTEQPITRPTPTAIQPEA